MMLLLEAAASNAIVAAVFAILAAAVARICRRPPLTHTLWLLVLIKLITPPLIRIPIDWDTAKETRPSGEVLAWREEVVQSGIEPAMVLPSEDSTGADIDSAPMAYLAGRAHTELDIARDGERGDRVEAPVPIHWDWSDVARAWTWIWVIGSIGWFAMAIIRIVQFHVLLRHGRPASPGMQESAAVIARRLGLPRCPVLWMVPGRISPLLWAVGGRCRLVLPQGLLDSLGPDHQSTLLAHELAHARRFDHWVRWVEFLATGLYWWHPVPWIARRAMRQAEEHCCDAWVLWALPGRARAYAEALLETVGFISGVRSAVPSVASGIGHVQQLRRRLTMILRNSLCPRFSWRAQIIAALLGTCLLPLAPWRTAAAAPGVFLDYTAPQSDRDTRELERRLDAFEQRLDRAIKALEARESRAPAARAETPEVREEKVEVEKTKPAAKPPKEKRASKQSPDSAPRKTDHKPGVETPVDPEEFARVARDLTETVRDALDPERMAELGREVAKALNSMDPKELEELGRKIEIEFNEAFSPERMKEIERQVEKAVTEAFSPERVKEMEHAIRESLRKTFDTEWGLEMDTGRTVEIEVERKQVKPKTRVTIESATQEGVKAGKKEAAPVDSTHDAGPTTKQLERRMNALEDKLDRLLKSLESNPL